MEYKEFLPQTPLLKTYMIIIKVIIRGQRRVSLPTDGKTDPALMEGVWEIRE